MKEQMTPFDEIISQIDSYIEDPAKVTKKTLMNLKSSLMDMKSYMDEEDSDMEDSEDEKDMKGKPAIVIAIGKAMKKKGVKE